MSKDIRSFFTVLSKKQNFTPSRKKANSSDESDADIIEDTPDHSKKKSVKKRKIHVLSSDSETDSPRKKNSVPDKILKSAINSKTAKDSKSVESKPKLKPVNIADVFGNKAVKQSKVEPVVKPKSSEVSTGENKTGRKTTGKKNKKLKTELGVHDDKAFEETLLDLDDDIILDNVDILDRTIDEALAKTSVKINKDVKKSPKKELPSSQSDMIESDEAESKNGKVSTNGESSSKKDVKKRTMKEAASETPSKKHKMEHTDSGIDPDQDAYEKKRYSAILYQKYLNRTGPKHHGMKEIPKGKPDCLNNLCFLRTGVLDSLDSEEFENLIKDHGGRVVHAVSKKVNYIVVGDDPGPAKLAKAESYLIPNITEDELLDMIKVKSGLKLQNKEPSSEDLGIETDTISNKGSTDCESIEVDDIDSKSIKGEVESKKEKRDKERSPEKKLFSNKSSRELCDAKSEQKPNLKKLSQHEKSEKVKTSSNLESKKQKVKESPKKEKVSSSVESKAPKVEGSPKKEKSIEKPNKEKLGSPKKEKSMEKPNKEKLEAKESKVSESLRKEKSTEQVSNKTKVVRSEEICAKDPQDELSRMSWADKYKPKDIKGIIGQQGDASLMNKLRRWLQSWYKNHGDKTKKHVRPSPWAKNDDGSYFKCALLSGSPGVGKTTTATLVAHDLGYDVVEFNASDTRSKKLLHEEVAQLLSTQTLAGFALGQAKTSKKRVLLMDEVDGMAGNEDRGGMQELINLIKNTSVPIICMCNDRNHQKIRSLANYCYDLRFTKPRMEQIRGAMMSVCFKEGIKITPDALSEIISGTGCDIRQTLNHLSMWSSSHKNLTMEVAQKETKYSQKDTVLGPWEVIRKVFNESDQKTMSLQDKTRLFFYDYSLGPLFVHENYIKVQPHLGGKNKSFKAVLRRAALAADAISTGDVIDAKIRRSNNWSLLEIQSIYSSVLPGHYMSGHFESQINFPGWLGKNSKRTKLQRMMSEIQVHTRTVTQASKLAIRLDYLTPLRNAILYPLKTQGLDGIKQAVSVMKNYSLLREDFDNLLELTKWSKQNNPYANIDSKIKSAFTRAYNKDVPLLPYAATAGVSKKKATASQDYLEEEEEEEMMGSDNEADDVTSDAMIKVKSKASAKGKKASTEPSTSKKRETKKGKTGKKGK